MIKLIAKLIEFNLIYLIYFIVTHLINFQPQCKVLIMFLMSFTI